MSLSRFMKDSPTHGRATETVTDALVEAIISGYLPPGTWLREGEVAAELHVSRTPVREALRRLADAGLAVKHAHQGTVVAGVSVEDVIALYAVREPLEATVARFSATRRTDRVVADLRAAQQRMSDAAERDDAESMAAANLAFHRVMSDATGNVYLQRFMLQIENALRRLPSTTYSSPSRRRTVLAEHGAIIEAIDAGDADAASQAAALHMRNSREVRLTLL